MRLLFTPPFVSSQTEVLKLFHSPHFQLFITMKTTKMIVISLTFSAFIGVFSGCSNQKTQETSKNTVADSTKNKSIVYECPMKCEGSKSDKLGKCPVCKMDLEQVK